MPAAVASTSPGALRNAGNASVAVSVIAVVKPTKAAQTMTPRADGSKIIPIQAASSSGPNIKNGQARRCSRSAITIRMMSATSCEPLSQPKAGPSRSALPRLAR